MHRHVRCRWAVSRATVFVVVRYTTSLRMARGKGGGVNNKWTLRIGMG